MESWTEEALDDACAAGEPRALDAAVAHLSSAHAYTRGRASEMLAGAPSDALRPHLERAFAEFPASIWWRVLALRYDAGAPLPEAALWVEALGDPATLATRDTDALYQIARVLPALPADVRGPVAAALIAHDDDEVAVVAAMQADRPLHTAAFERLARVTGPLRVDALRARVEGGDPDAWRPLAGAVLRAGPHAFAVLASLEATAPVGGAAALREAWDRRWFIRPVHARTADVAAALGDPDAAVRLAEWTTNRRLDVRAVARAGYVRTLAPDAAATALAELERLTIDELAGTVGCLDGRPDHLASWLETRALRHASDEVRSAAIEALTDAAQWQALHAWATHEPVPALRRTIERALALTDFEPTP